MNTQTAPEVAEALSLVRLAIEKLESLPREATHDAQRIWQAIAFLEEAKTRLDLVGIEATWQ